MNRKNFIRIFGIVTILAMVLSTWVSCNKTPALSAENFKISITSTKTVKAGTQITVSNAEGKGPLATDKVYLINTKDSGITYEYSIEDLTATSFKFTIGESFQTGTYDFCIKRGSDYVKLATINYTMQSELEPASGSTVYGQVVCGGQGVADVAVSDGYEIVYTDSEGTYQLKSGKKDGYVYITVPSGYEVDAKQSYSSQQAGILPLFWHKLTKTANVAERVDFTLYSAGDQTNHTVLLLGDMHLAGGKQNDLTQFGAFLSEFNSYVSSATGKVYAFTLGDMTWDLYWYEKNYAFDQYLNTMSPVTGVQVFHTIGNHDNDMKTSVDGNTAGWDAVDWDTATKYRDIIGPTYYSVNIGKVHYVVLDNIYCKNTTGGASADRIYTETVSTENLNWLKKDLAKVAKSTPVVVLMHAPLYNQTGSYNLTNGAELVSCFSGYSYVRFITGHTHKMWNIDKSSIHENNSGAICAAWWWAGYYNSSLNLAQDGAPGGYRVMDVKGTSMNSYFKGTSKDRNLQFRVYDRNQIQIVNPNAQDYATKRSDNQVLINVWDYDSSWKVEVTEDGKSLAVSQLTAYDPLYIQTYIAKRYTTESSSIFAGAFKTNHMFAVTASSATSAITVKVTDDEGTVYTQTIQRPYAFTADNYK